MRCKVLFVLAIILSTCKQPIEKSKNYNLPISRLIFSNKKLKNSLFKAFDLGDKNPKVFKVLISRRDRIVRVTIYQLILKIKKDEYPSSYFYLNNGTFLCYDGYELISNKKVDNNFMNNLNKNLEAKSSMIFDSRVIQFDIDSNSKIKLNMPAINPYDFIEKIDSVNFPHALNRR